LKALKVFETQHFERGANPKDAMSIGDVKGRLLKIRKEEATKAIDEILDTYGGDGPFFIDADEDILGFKIALYQDDPIQSRFKINDSEVRYYIEYNAETKALFVGWEQYDKDGKWKDRQWTSKIPFAIDNIIRSSGDIETVDEAKQILIEYIKSNKRLKEH
jgi:hypothetical protein